MNEAKKTEERGERFEMKDVGELETFIEHLPIGVIIVGLDLHLRLYNDLAMKLLDWDVGTLLSMDIMDAINDFPGLKIAFEHVLRDKSQQQRLTISVAEKPLGCTIIKAGDGGLILLMEDATNAGKIERIEREFIGSLLHKLRSPLSTIKTSLSMLQSGAGNDDPRGANETKEILDMCSEEANRLAVLINDMRDLFLIETKLAETDMVLENFSLSSVFKRVESELAKSLGQKTNGRIRFTGNPECLIQADFEKIKKVFLVVLKNALLYSPDGPPVELCCGQENGAVNIRVHDAGIGIRDVAKDLVFTKYFREDNYINKNTGGNGLGLFIAKSYVELMKGSIYFESKQGAGTTFHIMFPAIESR
jgi:two-component system phosphate regulon sensor histidine kinase PhoR